MRKYLRLCSLPTGSRRRAAMRLAAQTLRNEQGGEVLEYAIVAGLIVVATISTVGCVGQKLLARWNSINSSI